MSHDLRHQQQWLEEHPKDAGINSPSVYSILHYSCGNGWQLVHNDLTLDEAMEIKKRYLSTLQQAKIIQIIE